MSAAPSVRLALALPVGSPRAVAAATHVILYLLQRAGRTELDLCEWTAHDTPPRRPLGPSTILLVATVARLATHAATTPDDLEREVRAQVERQYARHGIAPVVYDLQLL